MDVLGLSDEIAKILTMLFPECLIKHYPTNITVFYMPNKHCTEVLITVFYSASGWYARIYDSDYMTVDDMVIRLCSAFEMDLVDGSGASATKACTYFIRGTIDGCSYTNKYN